MRRAGGHRGQRAARRLQQPWGTSDRLVWGRERSKMDRSLTAYVFFVLVVGLTCLGTGGCQTALSPVAPDPGVTLPTLAAAPSGCPAVEDICDDIGAIVHDACGEPEDYKSRGEYVKCRATTIASELSIYEGCFSMGELRKIAGWSENGSIRRIKASVRCPNDGQSASFTANPRTFDARFGAANGSTHRNLPTASARRHRTRVGCNPPRPIVTAALNTRSARRTPRRQQAPHP